MKNTNKITNKIIYSILLLLSGFFLGLFVIRQPQSPQFINATPREGYALYYAVKGEAVPKYRNRFQAAEVEAKQDHHGFWMDEWESNLTTPQK